MRFPIHLRTRRASQLRQATHKSVIFRLTTARARIGENPRSCDPTFAPNGTILWRATLHQKPTFFNHAPSERLLRKAVNFIVEVCLKDAAPPLCYGEGFIASHLSLCNALTFPPPPKVATAACASRNSSRNLLSTEILT